MTSATTSAMTSARHRAGRPDLLVRPPSGHDADHWWSTRVLDPVSQLRALAELYHQGVLTDDEFTALKWKLIG